MMKNIYAILLITMLIFVGCNNSNPYSDPQLWYNLTNEAGTCDYDVFYILPTCVWDRVNSIGDTLHYADPLLASDREAMRPSFELAQEIFGEEANFYSPYYRQITLESWRLDSLVEALFPLSMADITHAFDYYMKNMNNSRPFVLAGFSQGAKCVVELVKLLTPEQSAQLVAAYVIGYGVTASDTTEYKQIKPAKGNGDVGVTICYNTVASIDAISNSLAPSAICINPLNWTTSAQPAFLNDSVTVHVDKQYNVLIVDGFNPDDYYLPALGFLLKKGNYHLQELYFYRDNLSQNVKQRCHNFNSNEELSN